MVLADTNILSTFAKIHHLPLLLQLFVNEHVGVVPAVYAEFQGGVDRGYADLQAVIELVKQGHIELVVPTAREIFDKDSMPDSFDAGERETLVVARAHKYTVLTHETHVKNWCKCEQIAYLDLPGILRALWKTNLVSQELVQALIDEIERKDRLRFKNRAEIFRDSKAS